MVQMVSIQDEKPVNGNKDSQRGTLRIEIGDTIQHTRHFEAAQRIIY